MENKPYKGYTVEIIVNKCRILGREDDNSTILSKHIGIQNLVKSMRSTIPAGSRVGYDVYPQHYYNQALTEVCKEWMILQKESELNDVLQDKPPMPRPLSFHETKY